MPTRYVHANIISANWRLLANFYIKVFSCALVPPERHLSGKWLEKGTGVEDAVLHGAHLRLPGYDNSGPTLEIFSYARMEGKLPPTANRQGLSHLAFSVDDVQGTQESVIQHGGHALGEVTVKDVAGVGRLTFVYTADPEDNIIEIQHWSYGDLLIST